MTSDTPYLSLTGKRHGQMVQQELILASFMALNPVIPCFCFHYITLKSLRRTRFCLFKREDELKVQVLCMIDMSVCVCVCVCVSLGQSWPEKCRVSVVMYDEVAVSLSHLSSAVPVDWSAIESRFIFCFFFHTQWHPSWIGIHTLFSLSWMGTWSFLLSSYCVDFGRKIAFRSECWEAVLAYWSVWGDGVAAGAAGFFEQSCVSGRSWLGRDFGRREDVPLVLHRLHSRGSFFSPLSSAVPSDGACSSFVLQLLLTSYRLHLPHSPLFVAEAQHLHEVQLHLLVAGRKKKKNPHKFTCVSSCDAWRMGFYSAWGLKGFVSAADQVSVWKPVELLSVFEGGCCSRDPTADVFMLDFYVWCHFFFFFNPCIWRHTDNTFPQGKDLKKSQSLFWNARPRQAYSQFWSVWTSTHELTNKVLGLVAQKQGRRPQ